MWHRSNLRRQGVNMWHSPNCDMYVPCRIVACRNISYATCKFRNEKPQNEPPNQGCDTHVPFARTRIAKRGNKCSIEVLRIVRWMCQLIIRWVSSQVPLKEVEPFGDKIDHCPRGGRKPVINIGNVKMDSKVVCYELGFPSLQVVQMPSGQA